MRVEIVLSGEQNINQSRSAKGLRWNRGYSIHMLVWGVGAGKEVEFGLMRKAMKYLHDRDRLVCRGGELHGARGEESLCVLCEENENVL